MKTTICRWEELAINAFPAILSELYDGWVLRYSNGYTYRGNCVNPLYASTIDINEKIIFCENKYFEKQMPCIFKITECVEKDIDNILEDRGYTIERPADIMALSLTENIFDNFCDIGCVTVQRQMTENWLDDFVVLDGVENDPAKSTAKAMLSKIGNGVFCVSVTRENLMIACGLGVLEDEYIGLYDIRVQEAYRRQGLGTKLCVAIVNEAMKQGARTAYLQVASSNDEAIRLYGKLGFQKAYDYWYRIKTNPSSA